MSRRSRLVFLGIAAAIAVVAAVVIAATGGGSSASTTGVPTLDGNGIKHLRYKQGDTIRFKATAAGPQEIHVHGYNLKGDAAPGKPASFSFKATITGRFEIEYEGPGKQIGELQVDPR